MKIRNIPYGYQYKNGSIAIQEKETETVKRIFTEYLNGLSLLKIAEHLNNEQIEYMLGVCGWNKSRIKRIIEDERYLGTSSYPPIIDEDMHKTLMLIKSEKNTQKHIDRKSDIFNLGVPILCPKCCSKMCRRHDSNRKCQDWWLCQEVSANFLRFFLQTLILRGLQHFFFLIIITFSWFDTILTPIFYFWCQLIATLSSLVISLSILDISLTWLYTSIVTSMWACPIIY